MSIAPAQSQPAESAADSALAARAQRRRALWALFLAQILFGLFPIFGKLAMHAVPPEALTALRILTGSAVLGALALLRYPRQVLAARRDWALLLACALLGILLNQLLFLEGVHRAPATNAGLIVCTIPVFTYAIACAARQETTSARRWLGIAVALAGCLVLFFERHADFAVRREHALGNAFMVANCLLYSGYLVLSRPLLRRMPPLVLVAWAYALCLPAVPWLWKAEHWSLPGDARTLGCLVYVLIGPTVLAYLLIVYALAHLRASTTAVWNYLQPLVAGLTACFVLAEQPGPAAWLAAGLLFAGLWLVTRERARA